MPQMLTKINVSIFQSNENAALRFQQNLEFRSRSNCVFAFVGISKRMCKVTLGGIYISPWM
jgi:hypothetical protein